MKSRESYAPHIMPIDVHDPSLVLYLPLWYPHDDVRSYSYDNNRHALTVTGGVWSDVGFTGDGNDSIVCAAPDVLKVINNQTIWVWVNTADTPTTQGIVSRYLSAGEQRSFWFAISGGGILSYVVSTNGQAAGLVAIGTTGKITDNIWQFLAVTRSGTAVNFMLDTVVETKVFGTANDAFAGTSLLSIISTQNGTGDFLTGTIGELAMYNRVLSIPELLTIRDNTKWRYK